MNAHSQGFLLPFPSRHVDVQTALSWFHEP